MNRKSLDRQSLQPRCSLLRWLLLLALIGPGILSAAAAATDAETSDAETSTSTAPEAEAVLSVEDILTTPSEQLPDESPRCLSTHRIRDVHVIDDEHVVFRINRNSYYLVKFKHGCAMMETDATIVYDAMGQLCRLDSIRPIMGVGTVARVGPPCQIPGFQVISAEQLRLIKEARKIARRRPALVETPADEQASDPAEATSSGDESRQ